MENTPISGQPSQKITPKFFFLSLGALVGLITVVTSFLNLVFETLNKKFPDVLNATYSYGYNTYDYTAMRGALATLIIVFPVFIVLSYFWKKTMSAGLGRVDEIIRKWMLYLIIFLSSIVIIVDLVTLVQYFVSGEITTRFILKVAVTLLVALFVGIVYLWELKGKTRIWGFKVGLTSTIKSSAWVLALIIWAFCVMGSPFQQRQLRLDDRRLQDLQNIQWQVISYYQQKEKLPETLKDMANPLSGNSLPVDPEFEKGKEYEYNVLDAKGLTFELCATFALPIPKGWQEYNYGGRPMPMYDMAMGGGEDGVTSMMYPYPGGGMNESWDHEAGRTCFERTIDPEFYPPYEREY